MPVRLSEEIASTLRDEIIAGRLKAGTPLRLLSLANQFNVSSTPAREALGILARQGLLTTEPHRGFRVADIAPQDLNDLYVLHACIAGQLTERATRRLSDEQLDELEDIDRAQQDANDSGDFLQAADLNYELHRRIHLASGAHLLLRFLRETTPFVSRRVDPDVPGWDAQRSEGHSVILAAMRQRDGRAAGELMRAHIIRAGESAAAHLQAAVAGPRSR